MTMLYSYVADVLGSTCPVKHSGRAHQHNVDYAGVGRVGPQFGGLGFSGPNKSNIDCCLHPSLHGHQRFEHRGWKTSPQRGKHGDHGACGRGHNA